METMEQRALAGLDREFLATHLSLDGYAEDAEQVRKGRVSDFVRGYVAASAPLPHPAWKRIQVVLCGTL